MATTPNTATSQFIQAGVPTSRQSIYNVKNAPPIDDDDEFDEDTLPSFTNPALGSELPSQQSKGKAREQISPSPAIPSGNIGSSSGSGVPKSNRRMVGGVQVETRYTGVDTLDEPVSTTIARDLHSIYIKISQVLYPRRSGEGREVLRDWDLWGPLLLCLLLGIMLSLNAPPKQSLAVFTGVVVIISMGSLIVTVQAKLLGGRVSFFQALCVLGYCVAPLDIAALVACFVRKIWVRAPVSLIAWAWCVWASVNFFDGTKIEQQRILLAVYPLLLFYFILAWMILIL